MPSERTRIHFFASTALGGILFLLPVVVLIILLGKAIGLMMVVAEPMVIKNMVEEFLPNVCLFA